MATALFAITIFSHPRTEPHTMNVTINEKAKTLTIVMPITGPTKSASGKSNVLASTRGNKVVDATFKGQPITVGLNAYVPIA